MKNTYNGWAEYLIKLYISTEFRLAVLSKMSYAQSGDIRNIAYIHLLCTIKKITIADIIQNQNE